MLMLTFLFSSFILIRESRMYDTVYFYICSKVVLPNKKCILVSWCNDSSQYFGMCFKYVLRTLIYSVFVIINLHFICLNIMRDQGWN